MKEYTSIIIWAVVIGAAFLVLWRKGYLLRMSAYVAETKEELRKCTWPTRDELIGSSVVVVISTALLGLYTLGLDFVVYRLLRLII